MRICQELLCASKLGLATIIEVDYNYLVFGNVCGD